jgi:hypothetical protein
MADRCQQRSTVLWRIGLETDLHAVDEITVAGDDLGAGGLGSGRDDAKRLDHLVVDELGHLSPHTLLGQAVQLLTQGARLAPASGWYPHNGPRADRIVGWLG